MSRATQMRDAVLHNLEQGQIRKTRSTDHSKRQARDQMFFAKGVDLGAQLMKARIQNSVAGLDYGAAYYVPPTVEGSEGSDNYREPVSDVRGADVVASERDQQPAEVNDTCPNPEVFG